MSNTTDKQQYWSDHLRQAEDFDGSLSQYAQSQNLTVKSLYRWRHYFKQSPKPEPLEKALFAQVIQAPAIEHCLTLKVGEAALQFTRWPDPQWLANFIRSSDSP